MDTKDIILELRNKHGLSQDQLAEKVFVTRQAVSRWETGETIPNTETLKLLSNLFDVSINTLLGSPQKLICQCCGMPLEDSIISKEKDGFFNEEYCKWCYADGEYMYHDMDDLIDVCVPHMVSEQCNAEQARAYMRDMLPKLEYWRSRKNLQGAKQFEEFKQALIEEFNALHISGMPKVEKLNALVGKYVNLEYPLPNGTSVKYLEDNATYLGTQLESEHEKNRCFGIVGNADFLLVCTYGIEGADPELVVYKKRGS
ncbi:MAG: helix-turn-helix domain-containing protein [Erysipelotrichaceae bacterium]|nr:helix-turn-helix domain-containing protein [Erysipelotrichaceae bacterium]